MLGTSLRVGISPNAFWRLSLKEWRAMNSNADTPALARMDLDALIARFPDDQR